MRLIVWLNMILVILPNVQLLIIKSYISTISDYLKAIRLSYSLKLLSNNLILFILTEKLCVDPISFLASL